MLPSGKLKQRSEKFHWLLASEYSRKALLRAPDPTEQVQGCSEHAARHFKNSEVLAGGVPSWVFVLFCYILNVLNYYFNRRGTSCSRQPAKERTGPTGWSAHQRLYLHSHGSRTSLLSSSFLHISCTKGIGHGSTTTAPWAPSHIHRHPAARCPGPRAAVWCNNTINLYNYTDTKRCVII